MKPKLTQWKEVLTRWADVPDCGERRMMVHLLASLIAQEVDKWHEEGWDGVRDQYFHDGRFDYHAALIGINPQFVRELMDQFLPEMA